MQKKNSKQIVHPSFLYILYTYIYAVLWRQEELAFYIYIQTAKHYIILAQSKILIQKMQHIKSNGIKEGKKGFFFK